MKNIYQDSLEGFSPDELCAALESIGDETLRLEFKSQHVDPQKLAHIACSMANAEGGIIAIGFNEPNAERGIAFGVAEPVDISNRKKTSLGNALNGLVYPPMPVAIWGYSTGYADLGFMVIRIDRSELAPHEYLRQDRPPNLPIRRGTSVGSLTLAEIDALRARAVAIPDTSPLKNRSWRRVSLIPDGINPDFVYGLEVAPSVYSRSVRGMAIEDDLLLRGVEAATRGANDRVHGALDHDKCEPYGLWLHSGERPADTSGRSARPTSQVAVDSDGEIVIRFLQDDRDAFQQYLGLLLTGYAFTQEVFWNFQIAPRARIHLVMTLNSERLRAQPPLPVAHEDRFEVDLTQSFAAWFSATTMIMWRRANQPAKADVVARVLEDFARDMLPLISELHSRWK